MVRADTIGCREGRQAEWFLPRLEECYSSQPADARTTG
jgi:hypothetical protein